MTVKIEIEIIDRATARIVRAKGRIPAILLAVARQAQTDSLSTFKQVLDKKFGTGNRLTAGLFSKLRRTGLGELFIEMGIKAKGTPSDSPGAENIVRVLDEGTIRRHAIIPRALLGTLGTGGRGGGARVLALKKPEGVRFRPYVLAHYVRPRHFVRETKGLLPKAFSKISAIFKLMVRDL